jgi:HEAT repeat protein
VGSSSIDARTRAFASYGLGLLARRQGAGSTTQALARETLLEVAQQKAQLDVTVAALSALSVLPLGENERWMHCYPVFEQLLQQPGASDFFRAHIPTTVARLGGQPWAEKLALLAEAEKEHPLVRASALLAFGRFGDELQPALRARAVKAIEKATKRTDGFSERSFAMLALARIGDAESMKRFEREVVAGAHLDQPWVALGLGLAAREEAAAGADIGSRVEALRRAFRAAKAPETRGALAIALGLTRSSDAIAEVRKAFEQERIGRTRGHLAVALGLLGDRAALPLIRKAIAEQGREPEEIAELANALGMLRDPEAVPLLVAKLKEASSTAELGPVARALGRIGEARAAEALLVLAADPSASQLARTYAVAGLGVLFDAGPLPWSVPYTEDINYLAATPSLFASGGLLDLL